MGLSKWILVYSSFVPFPGTLSVVYVFIFSITKASIWGINMDFSHTPSKLNYECWFDNGKTSFVFKSVGFQRKEASYF